MKKMAYYNATIAGKTAGGNTYNKQVTFVGDCKYFDSGGDVKSKNAAALALIKTQCPEIYDYFKGTEHTIKVLGFTKVIGSEFGGESAKRESQESFIDRNSNNQNSMSNITSIFSKPYIFIPFRILWLIIKGIFKYIVKPIFKSIIKDLPKAS
jgi:hypothetical protein